MDFLHEEFIEGWRHVTNDFVIAEILLGWGKKIKQSNNTCAWNWNCWRLHVSRVDSPYIYIYNKEPVGLLCNCITVITKINLNQEKKDGDSTTKKEYKFNWCSEITNKHRCSHTHTHGYICKRADGCWCHRGYQRSIYSRINNVYAQPSTPSSPPLPFLPSLRPPAIQPYRSARLLIPKCK